VRESSRTEIDSARLNGDVLNRAVVVECSDGVTRFVTRREPPLIVFGVHFTIQQARRDRQLFAALRYSRFQKETIRTPMLPLGNVAVMAIFSGFI
jgi:hypothetical protein